MSLIALRKSFITPLLATKEPSFIKGAKALFAWQRGVARKEVFAYKPNLEALEMHLTRGEHAALARKGRNPILLKTLEWCTDEFFNAINAYQQDIPREQRMITYAGAEEVPGYNRSTGVITLERPNERMRKRRINLLYRVVLRGEHPQIVMGEARVRDFQTLNERIAYEERKNQNQTLLKELLPPGTRISRLTTYPAEVFLKAVQTPSPISKRENLVTEYLGGERYEDGKRYVLVIQEPSDSLYQRGITALEKTTR